MSANILSYFPAVTSQISQYIPFVVAFHPQCAPCAMKAVAQGLPSLLLLRLSGQALFDKNDRVIAKYQRCLYAQHKSHLAKFPLMPRGFYQDNAHAETDARQGLRQRLVNHLVFVILPHPAKPQMAGRPLWEAQGERNYI